MKARGCIQLKQLDDLVRGQDAVEEEDRRTALRLLAHPSSRKFCTGPSEMRIWWLQ